MRILHITPGCFDKGGISRYSRYQIEALQKLVGKESVRTLSMLGPNSDSFEQPFPVFWHGTSNGGRTTGTEGAQFARQILVQASTWRPDVVISAHVNYSPLLVPAAILSNAYSILNVYGLELWSGLSWLRRVSMGRASRIIADCHATARYVTDEKLHRNPPSVIWDPVDLERFVPGRADVAVRMKYGIPDPQRHFIVMSLGRLSTLATHKGFDRLIDAVAILAPNHPQLRLVICGQGNDVGRLKELAASRGVADKTVFTGPIGESDLANVYRSAHVFSLVSDKGQGRGEGIPLTPLEAMGCGIPIVVGNEDGSLEAVRNGRNGIVVSPRDRTQHVDALKFLIENPETRRHMGLEARRVAEESFSFDRFVCEHETLLRAL